MHRLLLAIDQSCQVLHVSVWYPADRNTMRGDGVGPASAKKGSGSGSASAKKGLCLHSGSCHREYHNGIPLLLPSGIPKLPSVDSATADYVRRMQDQVHLTSPVEQPHRSKRRRVI